MARGRPLRPHRDRVPRLPRGRGHATRTSSRSRCSRRSASALFETYFATIDRVLEPGGRALVQTIAVPEQRYATYRRTRDFIQAYVFPGGHLPSLEAMAARHAPLVAAARAGAGGDRPALRRHAAAVAGGVRRAPRRGARARLRRAVRPHLGVLPVVLRGRASGSASCATSRWCWPGPAARRRRADSRPCWTLAIETLEPTELLALQEQRLQTQWALRPRSAPTSTATACRERISLDALRDVGVHRQGGAAREPGGGAAVRRLRGGRPRRRDPPAPHERHVGQRHEPRLHGARRRRRRRPSARAACTPPACGRTDRVVHCLNYQLWTGGVTDHLILEAAGATVVPFGVGNTRGPDRGDPRAGRERDLVHAVVPGAAREGAARGDRPRAARPRPAHRAVRRRGGARQRRLPARARGDVGLRRCATRTSACPRCCRSSARSARRRPTCTSTRATSCSPRSSTRPRCERLPIAEGSTGELVCTHLARECQPLVRYRCRDTVTVTGTGPCACGRTAWRFRIAGRTDDMFNVRGVNVFPTAVRAVVAGLPELLSGHLRIDLRGPGPYDRIELRAEAADGLPDGTHGGGEGGARRAAEARDRRRCRRHHRRRTRRSAARLTRPATWSATHDVRPASSGATPSRSSPSTAPTA